MDVETVARGKKKLKTCTGRKKDVAFGGTLADLVLGDLALPTWTLALEGLGRYHDSPRRHLELGFHFGGICESGGTCGHHFGPLDAKRPTFPAQRSTYGARRQPRGA
jgi:hypothetical protein